MTQPIPGPLGLPFLGNLSDIDPQDSIGSLGRLAETYGEIFKLSLAGEEKLFISSHTLMDEICDEKRFEKKVSGGLEQIRNGVGDGLFTAYPGEHNWEIAHRVLMPGHETTSGLLSFLFCNLLKNPAAYHAAQKEVDQVVGRGPITVDHMSKLPYIEACLRETLRLTPTAPAFTVTPKEEITVLGGKYGVKKGTSIICLIDQVQRDPHVFGENAKLFKPERMLNESFSKLPKNSWKPFGNGIRACIGRLFAWQESILTTAILLQNFNFWMNDPSYTIHIKQTLTIKPKDFFMHASLKENIDPIFLEKMIHVDISGQEKLSKGRKSAILSPNSKKPLAIFYGSNAGTCEALAQILARAASCRGFEAHIDTLDTVVDKIPKDRPVVILVSSYEGQPPDNASHFFDWQQNITDPKKFDGVKFAIYGAGNRDWSATFHRVPKLLFSRFERHGATKLTDIGLGDVAGDIFSDFDKWQDEHLWSALGACDNSSSELGLEIEVDTDSRRSRLRQDVKEAIVISNKLLTAPDQPEKRQIVLNLPTGMSYKTGDYLAVLPRNNDETIRRVLKWAHLPWDAMLTIKTGSNTTIPTGYPISITEILGAYVELSQPATNKNIAKIAEFAREGESRDKITALANQDFETQILTKRRSPLDILEEYPEALLPLGDYLAMLPPMRIRQYSISSSPLADQSTCSITWSVLNTPSKAADSKRFLGVASNYLSSLEEGDRIHVAVKPSHSNFQPPVNVEKIPVLMFCAGTGLAPFRGFVEERSIQIAGGRKVAPAYLFIGCAHPERDMLFAEELRQWEADGAVKLFYAFSKAPERSNGAKYVQDRLWLEREEVVRMFNDGAKLYVCGSAKVGEGVSNMCKRIALESAEKEGKITTEERIEIWWASVKGERFASDVFA